MRLLLITNFLWGSWREMSPVACEGVPDVTRSLTNIAQEFDRTILINDEHRRTDSEFGYLPKHNLIGSGDLGRFSKIESSLNFHNVNFLTKRHLSAIRSEHNKSIIFSHNPQEICVAGFAASIDIIPTCLDLIQHDKKVFVLPDCVGDISKERKEKALEYLDFLSVLRN